MPLGSPLARALMIQGTGSDVGKSLMVAGLCRLFANRGLTVRPFKPQNMSNNAAVTQDGGEIGRAQALQARAAKIPPNVDMNPVLLKPEAETGAQVIVQGRRLGSMKARDYAAAKPDLLARVCESYQRLADGADLVLVEGAGSPAEVNLRAGDIANMGFAEALGLPVVLVADIHRGGVIAALIGTHAVLPESERRRIRGFIINKFRGDASLFDDGLSLIEGRTDWSSLGVLPHFAPAHRLPAEDAMALENRQPTQKGGDITIAVPRLPRIANFDDLDPLGLEPAVRLEIIPPGRALPGDADLVLLPGSKASLADLAAFREEGWDIDLAAHHRRGGRILGLCGGYQMLGRRIADPQGIEGKPGEAMGLGYLDIETVLTPEKRLTPVSGHHPASGKAVTGYEMHIGRTTGPDTARSWLDLGGRAAGAASADQRVLGTYLHGLFAADGFRQAFLDTFGAKGGGLGYEQDIESTLDLLASHLEQHLDIDKIWTLAGERFH